MANHPDPEAVAGAAVAGGIVTFLARELIPQLIGAWRGREADAAAGEEKKATAEKTHAEAAQIKAQADATTAQTWQELYRAVRDRMAEVEAHVRALATDNEELRQGLYELRQQYETLREAHEALTMAHSELRAAYDSQASDLAAERKKVLALTKRVRELEGRTGNSAS